MLVVLTYDESQAEVLGQGLRGLAADGCLVVVIESTIAVGERLDQFEDKIARAFDLRESLLEIRGVMAVYVGIRINPKIVPSLWKAVESGLERETCPVFMATCSVNQFCEADRYNLIEFLEGLLASGYTVKSERQVYQSIITSLISGAKEQSAQRDSFPCRRYQLVDGVLVERSLACRADECGANALGCWSDHFRPVSEFSSEGDETRKSVALIGQVRPFLLRSASKLGIESLVRGLGASFFAPYRRAVARRKFAQRVERFIFATHADMAWSEWSVGANVLICGWYGTETLGDKAILAGIVESLKASLQQPRFALVSLHPYVSEMTRSQMPELAGIEIATPAQGVALARSADLVVFGGGPLMALGVLAEMEAIFQVAKAHGAKTMIAGCGVGPLGHDWHNQSIRRILELSDLRIYRDQRSRELAAGLGVDTQADAVAEDPAFSWLLSQAETPAKQAAQSRQVLLLGLRDFPYRAYARHLDEAASLAAKKRYEQAVVDAMTMLVERNPQLTIRPLPMCTNHFGGDDRWFYRRLFRGKTSILSRLDDSLLGMELPPAEYCLASREARVGLVMRFHSLVFALGLDLPAVAIDYTLGRGKVNALATRFGVPQRSLDQLDADFLVTELQALLDEPVPQRGDWLPEFDAVVRSRLPALLQTRV